jgi:hypothetical protein
VLAACGGAAPRTAQIAQTVELAVPGALAVVELGDAVFVFDRDRVTIARGGTVIAHADAPIDQHWLAAGTLAAPDGNGRWVVGIAGPGTPWRVSASGELEAVGERLGLGGAAAVAIASAGTAFGVGLRGGAALSADGVHVSRLDLDDAPNVAMSRGRAALWSSRGLTVIDLATARQRAYPIRPRGAAFVADRLAVWSDDGLYLETSGDLHRITIPGRIAAVAASGPRLWVLTRDALYAVDRGALVRTEMRGSAIFGSPSGDVWVSGGSTGGGGVVRYSLDASSDDRVWQAELEPVFQRVCAHCHLPGGDAGIDLSTAGAWAAERSEIARRVLVTRTMPPAGTELAETDRQVIATWIGRR